MYSTTTNIELAGGQVHKPFRYQGRRLRCPPDRLCLDIALDRIGQARFGEGWAADGTISLPIVGKEGQLFAPVNLQKRKIEFRCIDVSDGLLQDALRLKQRFQSICDEISRAMYYGDVSAYLVGYDGSQIDIREHDAVLYLKQEILFGSGTVKIGKERHLVWVDRRSFNKWLRGRFNRKISSLSEKNAESFTEILIQYNKQAKCKFNKKQIKQLVDHARFPLLVTEAAIEAELWDRLGDARCSTGGSPRKDFQDAKKALKPLFRAAYINNKLLFLSIMFCQVIIER